MASHVVPDGHVGVYNKTLVAAAIDTVTFTSTDVSEVAIATDGTEDIFVKFGGGAPTVEGTDCFLVPSVAGVTRFAPRTSSATVVKLISSGTPVYSVSKVS